jgi:hypothetical protein
VHITNVETGEIAIYPMDCDYMNVRSDGTQEFWKFNWEEGNFACDCNRKLFFHNALDLDLNEEEITCSEGKYRVKIYDLDGQLLYQDEEVD